MNGYIKLHRKMLKWEWYNDVNTCRLFFHCLLKANWEGGNWRGVEYEPGQFITSLSKLSAETGLSVRQVRDSLNKLKMTGEVTSKATNRYSVITVNNWNEYQTNDKQTDTQDDKQSVTILTTDKEYKEIKNIRNKEKINKGRFVKPTVEEVRAYCQERNNGINAQQFVDYYESKGWLIGKNHMKDWKASVRTWENRRKGESNGNLGTVPREDEEQRNRELDEYIKRQQAGEFDDEDAELRAILG